jgi:hypothetical protein
MAAVFKADIFRLTCVDLATDFTHVLFGQTKSAYLWDLLSAMAMLWLIDSPPGRVARDARCGPCLSCIFESSG